MLPNHIILLGGGASVQYLGDIEKVKLFLQDKFCIGINFSYKFIKTTCNLGCDETTYNDDRYHSDIASLPLWIGKEHNKLKNREPNSVFLLPARTYDRELKTGVYRASLSGIFALSLAIKLLSYGQKNPVLYLLGYDYGPLIINGQTQSDKNGKPITHWYQDDFVHRGTGKVNWYQQTGIDPITHKRMQYAELEFKPFASEKKIKIYNVSGISNIPHFEHMTYEEFYKQNFESVPSQHLLRAELWETLQCLKQENSI